MSKHTPGPWTIGTHGEFGSYNADIINGQDGAVCQVYGIPLHSSIEYVEASTRPDTIIGLANARLIAAAPDLLAACEAIHKRFQGTYPDGFPKTLLREAIAKAKGGAD